MAKKKKRTEKEARITTKYIKTIPIPAIGSPRDIKRSLFPWLTEVLQDIPIRTRTVDIGGTSVRFESLVKVTSPFS